MWLPPYALGGPVITANLPNSDIYGCTGPSVTVNVPVSGIYAIKINGGGWRYNGTYNNLNVSFAGVCSFTSSLPPTGGGGGGYFTPGGTCVEYLSAGNYTFSSGGSDAGYCASSWLQTFFGGSLALRRLSLQ